ncbi:MAG: right-handed parallel beta-helix repeat-containing protein, partial [Anaerolineae bacterium]|nr:right-handed parallel beta-helix repeat-containing protein [Anaerolineae bacterium]
METPTPADTDRREPLQGIKPGRWRSIWLALIPLLLLMAALLAATWPAAAAGPTYVGGPISVPTTWALADSPYIVTGTVTVRQGAILTIEPGVTISFTAGTGLEVGSTTSSGRLVASGTFSQPITFTALTLPSTRGFWDGIEFSANSLSNTLRYCLIEYAGTGVYSDDSDSHVIEHCVFRHNGGDTTPPPGGAMTIDGDGLTIADNQAYDNELGLRFRKSFDNIITGNQIYENNGFGIGFVVAIGDGGGNNTITANQVHDNGGDGLSLDTGWNNQVRDNQIYGNGGDGVRARFQGAFQLIDNIVRGNGQNGLTCIEPYSAPIVHSNVLCGNVDYGIEYFLASTTLPAEGNWFGTNSP